jgi:chaperonin GroES
VTRPRATALIKPNVITSSIGSPERHALALPVTKISSTRSRQLGVDLMHVRPLHDRILVQRLDEGEQHIGGIIIPDSAKEKPQRGKVIAAGDGKVTDDGDRVKLDVKAGDTILFGK